MLSSRFRCIVLTAAVIVVMDPAGAGRSWTAPAEAGRQAQNQDQNQPPQPTFRTEASYVRVDVFPTANGLPVMDLRQEDFEVLEDRAPQKIDTFEHVVIRGGMPQETRREPSTVAESRAMVEMARARLFVIFLDINHVEVEASRSIRQPLVNALNRLIGPDDLVGVMTPEMSAADVTFARKTTTIEGFLTRYWYWGERGRLNPVDPREDRYRQCYPGFGPSGIAGACPDEDRGVADEMIARHREKQTLDALENLSIYLRGVREERKAILAVTDGWLLYRPNTALTRRLRCTVPAAAAGVDPRNGRLTTRPPQSPDGSSLGDCESDRMQLAQIDDEQQLRRIFDEANRANASFYPVDPRGLVVFDTSLGEPRTGLPPPGATSIVPLSVDRNLLQARSNSLRDLAFATDGMAIVDTNNLEAGLQRVTADLSSYYLMGYYSTGKLDGRFHSITVRVKRSGVQVRARRGYLAPTVAEVTASSNRTAPAAPANAAVAAEARALELVLAPLSGFAREAPLRLNAVAGWTPGNTAAISVVGELSGEEWKGGADTDVMLTSASGDTLATARVQVAAGSHGFRVVLAPSVPLTSGDYTIRVRTRGRATDAPPSNEVLRLLLPASPGASGAVFIRRGPTTGNREVPTADLRFRRSEQLRVEVPAPSSGPVTARLLDRNGKPLPVPVAAAVRDDSDGSRWHTAQLPLTPLAAGDYVVEIATEASGTVTRTLLAFRVVP
jgi:VWFA-related protein